MCIPRWLERVLDISTRAGPEIISGVAIVYYTFLIIVFNVLAQIVFNHSQTNLLILNIVCIVGCTLMSLILLYGVIQRVACYVLVWLICNKILVFAVVGVLIYTAIHTYHKPGITYIFVIILVVNFVICIFCLAVVCSYYKKLLQEVEI